MFILSQVILVSAPVYATEAHRLRSGSHDAESHNGSDTAADDWHHRISPKKIFALAMNRLKARGKGIRSYRAT